MKKWFQLDVTNSDEVDAFLTTLISKRDGERYPVLFWVEFLQFDLRNMFCIHYYSQQEIKPTT